jgi:hypothetical protein
MAYNSNHNSNYTVPVRRLGVATHGLPCGIDAKPTWNATRAAARSLALAEVVLLLSVSLASLSEDAPLSLGLLVMEANRPTSVTNQTGTKSKDNTT